MTLKEIQALPDKAIVSGIRGTILKRYEQKSVGSKGSLKQTLQIDLGDGTIYVNLWDMDILPPDVRGHVYCFQSVDNQHLRVNIWQEVHSLDVNAGARIFRIKPKGDKPQPDDDKLKQAVQMMLERPFSEVVATILKVMASPEPPAEPAPPQPRLSQKEVEAGIDKMLLELSGDTDEEFPYAWWPDYRKKAGGRLGIDDDAVEERLIRTGVEAIAAVKRKGMNAWTTLRSAGSQA